VLRFVGYEESRKMFEEATGMSTKEALAGRDELVSSLSELVERYGMEPRNDAYEWKADPEIQSLNSFRN
jgi:hypothetical protein